MIRIITDSTADFTKEEAQELSLTVVPLCVNMNGAQYLDGIDLVPEQFYAMLEHAQTLPTTSQPSPECFLTHFEQAKAAGDTVLCVLLSASLSGTFQSAQIAKDEAAYDGIYLVDSKTATLAENLLVRRAVQRREEGMTAAAIAADLELAREQLRLYAVVDTLRYLHKGGRLSGAVALAGGLLGIKPVIGLRDGALGMAGKARGLPAAYRTIFQCVHDDGGVDETWPVMVGYTGGRSSADALLDYAVDKARLERPMVSAIGTVIGTHAGPGACGIAFFAK